MIKKDYKTCFFITFLFVTSLLKAQTKGEWIKFADDAFNRADYPTAINYYNRVFSDTAGSKFLTMPYEVTLYNAPVNSKDSTQKAKPSLYDYLVHQLANAYRLNWDYKAAENFYNLASKKPNLYPQDKFMYGVALMNVKKYKQAMDEFEGVAALSNAKDSLKKEANHLLSSCFFALDTNSVHKLVTVNKLDTLINSGTASFAPMYFKGNEHLLYTCAKKGNTVSDPVLQDGSYLCDVFVAERKDETWVKTEAMPKAINSPVHEGAAQMTLNEDLFFTRWTDANKNESAIYICRSLDGKYFEPLKLGNNVNLPDYKSAHPFLTMDGTRLYFSSNRPGGKGGMDIWYCNIDENGTTSSPICLGPQVNTSGDEVTPFFHAPSSTLFFASNGHPGLGGLDIFKCAYSIDDSVYATPRNIGAPINSSKDDAYLIMDRMQLHGFFASDREDCPSGHCYDIYAFDNEPIFFDLSGQVTDADSSKPIANALITLKDIHGNDEPILLKTDEKGFYNSSLKDGMDYFIKAQKNTYFGDASNFSTKGLTQTEHFVKNFVLTLIPDKDVIIEGIEYDLNKTTLRSKSKEILDKLAEVLKINDNLNIEIKANTDTRGSDVYNLKLSEGRAKSCVDYLITKGINKDRLVAKGQGETVPLISDAEIEKLATPEEKESAHQKNRRTAFRVIGESKIHFINQSN